MNSPAPSSKRPDPEKTIRQAISPRRRNRPGSPAGTLILLAIAAIMVLSAIFVVGLSGNDGRPEVDLGDSVEGHAVEADPADLDELGVADDGHSWTPPDEVRWPDRASFQVPVSGDGSAEVTIHDQVVAEGLGIDGVIIEIDSEDEGKVGIELQYKDWSRAFGGGWEHRLDLVSLPACALTTPELEECRTQRPIEESVNDTDAQTLRANVENPASADSAAVLAATADTEDDSAGDFSATDLEATGSWTHSGSSGAFTYSYPMEIPEVPGPMPEVVLGYSSQTVDGRTSGRNNQASWVGDGWGYQPGFIERTYLYCAGDDGGNNDGVLTGDKCWDGDSASMTMSLGGTNAFLVQDDETGQWRASTDAGWKIELLGSAGTSSDDTSERWKLTDNAGTEYYFASRASETDSRLTVPVFGNHAGEPCYQSGDFAASGCDQAYRWMLDKVVDVHGNIALYDYAAETDKYGAAATDSDVRDYDRSAHVTRIDYGMRSLTDTPAARIDFAVADRCLASCGTAEDPTVENWPDTPWDLTCDAAPCDQYSPAFFSTKRLDSVTTRVRTDGAWSDVARWDLEYEFKDYGSETQTVLWLESVQHTGLVGGVESTPPVTFDGQMLPNRVDHDDKPVMWRWRISAVTTETGGVIGVRYSEPDCGAGDLPAELDSNSRLCYPFWWTPPKYWEPELDYFHKYVVTEVFEQDTTAGQPVVQTFYDYATTGGGTDALWAWDDSEFTSDDLRTWSQWRGYAEVTTSVGHPDDGPQTITATRYYRGMDGQPDQNGDEQPVAVTNAQGETVTDHEALGGRVFETRAFDDQGLFQTESTRYWTRLTATSTHVGGEDKAWIVKPERVDSYLLLDSSTDTWRQTRTETEYDSRGRATVETNHGDLAVPDDQQCRRTWYVDNDDAHLYNLIRRQRIESVDCDTTPNYPSDLASEARNYYDGATLDTATPTRGLVTKVETVVDWNDDTRVWAATGHTTYDALGRPLTVEDALGNTTTTTYTPADHAPTTSTTVTNALGHTSSEYYEPAWGLPVRTVDPNGNEAVLQYDPLGRLTAGWNPDRTTDEAPSASFEYQIAADRPSAVLSYGLTPTGEPILGGVELYDSLLRPVQTQLPNPIGGRLVHSTQYNTRGLTAFTSGPNWIEDTEPGTDLVYVTQGEDHARTFYTYDTAGRETETSFLSHQETLWSTETLYGGSTDGWMVRSNPPQGATPTATIEDAQGNLIAKREYHGATATGTYDQTDYVYDARGNLTEVTDEAGNQWRYEYDLLGRRTAQHDPDTGTTTAEHDLLGQLTQTVDELGNTISLEYDAIGRPTARWEGQIDTGRLLADWSYDTETNGIGLPAWSRSYPEGADGEAITTQVGLYDEVGRPGAVRTTIPQIDGMEGLADAYTIRQFYLPGGQVSHINYPSIGGIGSESVVYDYNDLGHITKVFGNLSGSGNPEGEIYVAEATYTAWGELAQRVLGSGEQAYQTWTFEDGTRREASFLLSRDASNGTTVADLDYQYDQAGNLLSISDTATDAPAQPERQCFTYDYLRRLTEAWAQADTSACAENPTEADMGGPAGYWNTYQYDTAGNRTGTIERTPDTATTETTYSYTADDGTGPGHLIDSIDFADSPRTDTYTWDAAGNLTERTVAAQTETFAWNSEGKLASITGGEGTTDMIYNADNQRIARIDPDGSSTLFVADHELTVDAQGILHVVRTYSHNGEMIATRSTDEGLTFIGSGHHGTAMWAISAATMAVTYRRQDPFGKSRGTTVSEWTATQQGFHTGTEDPNGLISMGARFYDPATGRFVSRDPIIAFNNPQQINGYAYAGNNPIVKSDPSGLYETEFTGDRDPACNTCGGTSTDPIKGPTAADDFEDDRVNVPTDPEGPANENAGYDQMVMVGYATEQIEWDGTHFAIIEIIYYIWCIPNTNKCDGHQHEGADFEPHIFRILGSVTIYKKDDVPNVSTIPDQGLMIYDLADRAARIYDETMAAMCQEDCEPALSALDVIGIGGDAGSSLANKVNPEQAKNLVRGATVFTILSAAYTAYDEYQDSESIPSALTKGGMTGAGAFGGAALGAWLGGFCGPVALVCIPVGAGLGGYYGGRAGGEVGDRINDDLGW